MAAATEIIPGPKDWELTRDSDGHRQYLLTIQVKSPDGKAGPAQVIQTPGLPRPGSLWIIDNADIDVWAWCHWDATIRRRNKEGLSEIWDCTYTFSTRPMFGPSSVRHGGGGPGSGGPGSGTKGDSPSYSQCKDLDFQDPLLEPQKVSGGTVNYTREEAWNRPTGSPAKSKPIRTISHEPILGPAAEFDRHKGQIHIEHNVAILNEAYCNSLVNKVNDRILWGHAKRCVKLSKFDWEKKWYGLCYPYYTRTFSFDIDDDSFDRLVTPQCTKMIRGTWTYALTAWTYVKDAGADINDPSDFVRAEDYLGRPQKFLLKADGTPCLIEGTEDGTDPDEPAKVLIERYDEANFLTLGIPTVF